MCLAMPTPEKFASRALFKALWSGRWAIHPEHKVMGFEMVRRSIFMPQRSRAGTDASAHVGHASRLFGRRGGAGVSDKEKNKYDVPPLVAKLAHNISKRKHAVAVAKALSTIKKSA